MVQSKRKVEEQKIYCRKCQKTKFPRDFYSAVDEFLDTNGYFSICKQCINEIYNGFYSSEKSIEKAVLKTCRTINLKYDPDAIEAAKAQLATMAANGTKTDNFFGFYKAKLVSVAKLSIQDDRTNEDFTFHELSIPLPATDPITDHDKNAEELQQFWGDNLEYNDYVWLEAEYAKWKETHKIDTRSEVSLLKMIVLKLFDIRKARNEDRPTNKLEEDFQRLLKTSALAPIQASVASQGKLADTYGMLIKMIEEETPGEHYKDYKLFDDFFNFKSYLKNYVSRPITNFFTGQKNYTLIEDDKDVVLDDSFELPDMPVPASNEENNLPESE